MQKIKNSCIYSSCCDDPRKVRRFLILTGLKSSRIYIVDTKEPKEPKIFKTIEPETIKEKANLSSPHTVHCLANGNIMISFLGINFDKYYYNYENVAQSEAFEAYFVSLLT